MKKILLILLCIIMIFCNVVWTSAATNNHCVTEISEYDMYKELISVDDETLKGEGFSEEDIRKLRETDPAMELIELSKKI